MANEEPNLERSLLATKLLPTISRRSWAALGPVARGRGSTAPRRRRTTTGRIRRSGSARLGGAPLALQRTLFGEEGDRPLLHARLRCSLCRWPRAHPIPPRPGHRLDQTVYPYRPFRALALRPRSTQAARPRSQWIRTAGPGQAIVPCSSEQRVGACGKRPMLLMLSRLGLR